MSHRTTASSRLFISFTAPEDEYLNVRVFFFWCPVSYVFVKELDDSAFLQFVWANLFHPAGNLCRFLSTAALEPSREYMFSLPLRHRERRGSQFLPPQEQPPLRHLQAERSCGYCLTIVLVAPACSLSTSLQFREQVGLHVRSDYGCPPHGFHSLCAQQCQGPPLRHSPDVRRPLGDEKYRVATARVNWLLTANLSPWIPGRGLR